MMKEHAREVQEWIASRSIDAAGGKAGDTTEDDKMT